MYGKRIKTGVIICLISLILMGCSTQKESNLPDQTSNEEQKQGQEETKQENTNEEGLSDSDSESQAEKESDEDSDIDEPVKIDYDQVKPNELGNILVVMYHGIMDNPPYQRTAENFIKDLQYMYDHGYRPISIRDYVDNHITVEPGLTPIVLTFDDGLSSTFHLIKENGELVPDPNSAVGLMEQFAKDHSDFGKAAVFYINGGEIFEGEGTVKDRLEWLVDHGYDVSNHTQTHVNLGEKTMTAETVQKEIGTVDQLIKEVLPNYQVDTFAYPFGSRPDDALKPLIEMGSYNGQEYTYKVAFREGFSGPFVPLYHVQADPMNQPRVRGNEGADWDLWFAFQYYEDHPEYRFISDGNPNRIAVPEGSEDKINQDKVKDKEIYVY